MYSCVGSFLEKLGCDVDGDFADTFAVGVAFGFKRTDFFADKGFDDARNKARFKVADPLSHIIHACTGDAFVQSEDKAMAGDFSSFEAPDAHVEDKLGYFLEVFVKGGFFEHFPDSMAKVASTVLKNKVGSSPQHLFDIVCGKMAKSAKDQQWDIFPCLWAVHF